MLLPRPSYDAFLFFLLYSITSPLQSSSTPQTHSYHSNLQASTMADQLKLTNRAMNQPGFSIVTTFDHRPRPRRPSLSPWRFRPKPTPTENSESSQLGRRPPSPDHAVVGEKKGLWSWRPIRALSRIGMRRVACVFSVEVVAIKNLPASMNGLRVAVAVRKKDTKNATAQRTMPVRVLHGSADFDETKFARCHVYYAGGAGTGKPLKFEPRLFAISVTAVDAPELDFGRTEVDLSELVKESMARSSDGDPVSQWDAVLKLSGKAKGGDLLLKLSFQIMEDGGLEMHQQGEGMRSGSKHRGSMPSSASFACRDESKWPIFSIASPRSMRLESTKRNLSDALEINLKGIDGFNPDELEPPAPSSPSVQKSEPESKMEEWDLQEFEVFDKGIEVEVETNEEDSIAKEFLQMLELEGEKEAQATMPNCSTPSKDSEDKDESDPMVLVSELGMGLGCVIQTRDGGYLVSMSPFDVKAPKKETPKLAMQISRPFILRDQESAPGFQLFQRLAMMGTQKLISELLSLVSMDELMGKTAEQIAFEGIASVITNNGRSKDVAHSRISRSITPSKEMAVAMTEGRKERITTGIWNVHERAVTIDEILACSLQKIEVMAAEALKVQADIAGEEAPFEVSPLISKQENENNPLNSAAAIEETSCRARTNAALLVLVQLRDPQRRYEAVGAPVFAVMQATGVGDEQAEEDERFRVTSLHVGGLKRRSGEMSDIWDGEKQRLSALKWLMAHGLGKKKNEVRVVKGGHDLLWSVSSRVMADVWLKHIRNPDVMIPSK